MTASAALTETRVPRQVSARLAASEARYRTPEPDTPTPAEGAAPANQPATPPAAPANTQPTPAADPRHADPNYWKQRFEVTSGILARERDQRVAQMEGMNTRITELQTQIQTLQAAAPTPEIDLTAFYTPAQIEAYGEEQCRVMASTAMKAAQVHAQKAIDAAVQPLKQRQESDATHSAEQRKQAFVDKLTELVPDWQVTDKDPRWCDEIDGWLAQEDEHGAVRQSILNAHIQSGNAVGAAKMFKAFTKSIAVVPPPVAPSGSGAGAGESAPVAQPGLTHPSPAEKKAFYTRSALNKVKDSERTEFEARLKLPNPAR